MYHNVSYMYLNNYNPIHIISAAKRPLQQHESKTWKHLRQRTAPRVQPMRCWQALETWTSQKLMLGCFPLWVVKACLCICYIYIWFPDIFRQINSFVLEEILHQDSGTSRYFITFGPNIHRILYIPGGGLHLPSEPLAAFPASAWQLQTWHHSTHHLQAEQKFKANHSRPKDKG